MHDQRKNVSGLATAVAPAPSTPSSARSLSDRIMLSASDVATCPHCEKEFPVGDALARTTIERYESEFASELGRQETALRARVAREERERAQEDARFEIEKRNRALVESNERAQLEKQELEVKMLREVKRLEAQVAEREQDAKEYERQIADAREKAAAQARKRFESELASAKSELEDCHTRIAEHSQRELALRREKKALEEAKRDLDLEVQRTLDAERGEMEQRIVASHSERFRLREAELHKKIADAQKVNADLTRKLEQGSSQLRGEVLECEIEQVLAASFPLDTITEVKKGVRGADVVQTVRSRGGQEAGVILWELKRADNWSNAWIPKLKDDQRAAGASVAVLVTTTMPRGESAPFVHQDGVWIVSLPALRPVAETLRFALLEGARNRSISESRDEAKGAVFEYLCSPAFGQKLRAAVDASTALKQGIDTERAAMARIWKKREQEANRVVESLLGIVGELQGLSRDSLPGLSAIGQLDAGEPSEPNGD